MLGYMGGYIYIYIYICKETFGTIWEDLLGGVGFRV